MAPPGLSRGRGGAFRETTNYFAGMTVMPFSAPVTGVQ